MGFLLYSATHLFLFCGLLPHSAHGSMILQALHVNCLSRHEKTCHERLPSQFLAPCSTRAAPRCNILAVIVAWWQHSGECADYLPPPFGAKLWEQSDPRTGAEPCYWATKACPEEHLPEHIVPLSRAQFLALRCREDFFSRSPDFCSICSELSAHAGVGGILMWWRARVMVVTVWCGIVIPQPKALAEYNTIKPSNKN